MRRPRRGRARTSRPPPTASWPRRPGSALPPGFPRAARHAEVFHEVYGSSTRFTVYAAGVDLTDADIECREGRQIVFVDAAAVARGLDLTTPRRQALPAFLESDTYRRLIDDWRPCTLDVHPVPGPGAEDVVVGTSGADEGAVFTGTEDGSIFRVSHDGAKVDRIAQTQGRPLGLEIDLDGRLLVCDAHRGLLRVDTAQRRDRGRDRRGRRHADEVLQQRRDRLRRHRVVLRLLDQVRHRAVEGRLRPEHPHRPAGRLDTDGTVEVVLDGLAFANGVALSADEGFVCRRRDGRPHRRPPLALRQPQGHARPAVPEPAGLPRQHRARQRRADLGDHRQPRDPVVERLQTGPLPLRKLVTEIPDRLQPQPKQTVRVQAYDDDGTLVHDIDIDPKRARRGLPHGHRRPGARGPGLDGQPARARGRRLDL